MRQKIHALALTGLALAIAVLTGCATVPPPLQMMDRAQAEIRAARNAGAETAAPDTLAEAERRLAAAQQFTTNNQNGKAADQAAEAEAAAATARARAQAAQLDREIAQQTRVNRNLQGDLERRQAAAAAAQQAAMAPPPAPASAASTGANGSVTLPSIELGQPAPATTSGAPNDGGQP